jgi:hypothetical protein
MSLLQKTVTRIRLGCMSWLGRIAPWLTPEIYYQAQTWESDAEWSSWRCIGWQTKSRIVIRRILAAHLEAHPAAKVRVRRIVMWSENAPLTSFLPNVKSEP